MGVFPINIDTREAPTSTKRPAVDLEQQNLNDFPIILARASLAC